MQKLSLSPDTTRALLYLINHTVMEEGYRNSEGEFVKVHRTETRDGVDTDLPIPYVEITRLGGSLRARIWLGEPYNFGDYETGRTAPKQRGRWGIDTSQPGITEEKIVALLENAFRVWGVLRPS